MSAGSGVAALRKASICRTPIRLFKRDLIDTLRIWQFPVVIGSGKRLFGAGTTPRRFRLVDAQQATTGAVLHVYERAGELKYGEFEVGGEPVVFESKTQANN